MPRRAAHSQGEPGRLKVETGRPQVQRSSGCCIPPPARLRHRVTVVPALGGTRAVPVSVCPHPASPLCPSRLAGPGRGRWLRQVPAAAAPLVSRGLRPAPVCPRLAGEVAGAEWGRTNESTASPYFSPAPLFLSQHFRTIPPTRSLLPPPLVAGAGLSPSPCLRLPRPFPAPPSPLRARRRAGRQRSPHRRGCVCLHACPPPHPRLSPATRCPWALPWGEGGVAVSPLLQFAIGSLALLGSQCVCQGKSLQPRLPAKGGGCGRAFCILCSESFPEIPSHSLGLGTSWRGKEEDREGVDFVLPLASPRINCGRRRIAGCLSLCSRYPATVLYST
ncbi:zinc finger protein ZFPM1-like [Motacilla alba alba]|uniref:zinc finger protein ZFPM1-like n=1 Tax=Motacilla alba alba TaxID=1094192 RepID=UPI0018D5A862|nr:zinc finger protein ZFPM1-like [Motacilla alba alba]